jgi:hypothetical protein
MATEAQIEIPRVRRTWSLLRLIGGGRAALLGLLVAVYAGTALLVPIVRSPLIAERIVSVPVLLVLHLIGGAIAVAVGAFQLSSRIRARRIAVHRWIGRLYVIGVLVGGIAGLLLSMRADGGLTARFGFGMLAVVWLFSTTAAYIHIRNRRIKPHRAWMLRSYALTFAAVTLRIWLPLSQIAGIPFMEAYATIAWLCWVPNLVVVEWFVVRRRTALTAQPAT